MSHTTPDGIGAAITGALAPLILAGSMPGAAVVRLPEILADLHDARRQIQAAARIDSEYRDELCHRLCLAKDYARILAALARCQARHQQEPGIGYEAQLARDFADIGWAADAALAALDALPATGLDGRHDG